MHSHAFALKLNRSQEPDLFRSMSDLDQIILVQVEVLTCWTERATCIWMVWLHELKKLSSPGIEAQDRSTWGESFHIFAPWLGSGDKVVELEHALAASKGISTPERPPSPPPDTLTPRPHPHARTPASNPDTPLSHASLMVVAFVCSRLLLHAYMQAQVGHAFVITCL